MSSMSRSKDNPKRSETGVTQSGKPGTILKSRLHQNFLSHEVVTQSKKKTGNFPFLKSVTHQFSSLPIFVDCNKVRKHFVYDILE